MDPALAWAIVGLVLVIAELLSGTFYLLMLAIAAFGSAGAAWVGQPFPVQSIVAGVIAAAGCYGVHVYRVKSGAKRMAPIDAGMPASLCTSTRPIISPSTTLPGRLTTQPALSVGSSNTSPRTCWGMWMDRSLRG